MVASIPRDHWQETYTEMDHLKVTRCNTDNKAEQDTRNESKRENHFEEHDH